MNNKKKKHPARWLLLIPVQMLLSIGILIGSIYADTVLWSTAESEAMGHPVPVLSLFGVGLAVFLLFLMIIISIVATCVSASRNKKEEEI